MTVAQTTGLKLTLTLEVELSWDKHNLRAYTSPMVSSPNNCNHGLVTFLATLSTYSHSNTTQELNYTVIVDNKLACSSAF